MVMIRGAIVEDEVVCAWQLEQYLRRYEKERNVNFHISIFEDGLSIARNYQPE